MNRQYFFLLAGILWSCFAFSKTTVKRYSVVVTITQTSDYCGGARPSEEILQELAKPGPLPNTNFYLVKGQKNGKGIKIIRKVKTDSEGSINLLLSKGIYALLSEDQIKPFVPKKNDEFHIWDNNCLKQKWEKPLVIVNPTRQKKYNYNIHKVCFYAPECCEYRGPYPP